MTRGAGPERGELELEVLLCDNHLLAVVKPAGLPVVPDDSGDESLFERAKVWVKREYDKPGEVFLGVVHRLDRPVSGVVLFARTSKAAARLAVQFQSGRPEKRYLAVAEGRPRHAQGVLEQWLQKDAGANRVRAVEPETPGAKRAITRWRVAREGARQGSGHTVFELRPETGRSHQIRVALASIGCPILGDLKYGASRPLPDKSVALHAASLVVDHPTRSQAVQLECPTPERAWWPT